MRLVSPFALSLSRFSSLRVPARRGARLAAILALASAPLWSGLNPAQAQTPQPPQTFKPSSAFPTVQLNIGMYLIHAQVAANEADREQGLMFRDHLDPNSGMLFVFDEDAGHCFWMKNTEIPLSVAFIAADGTITDLDEMQAETTNNHCPTRAGRYVLEMSKGWFTQKGIQPGMQVQGLPGVSAN